MKHFVGFLSLIAFLFACEGEERFKRDIGSEYFPVATGMYCVYNVEEIRYAAGAAPAIARFELMTAVVDSFPSGNDQYTFVIHRSKRSEDTAPWEPLDTWSVRKDDRQVVVAEGNVPFVKLRFPVAAQVRWDGNALNTLGADEYALKAVDQRLDVDGTTFEHTATVVQEDNRDAIVFRDVRSEVYARGIGLVYRETVQLHYCTDDACLGQQKIDHGVEMKIAIKEYGKH